MPVVETVHHEHALGTPVGTLSMVLKIFEIIFSIIVICLICILPAHESPSPSYPGRSTWYVGEEFAIATAVFSMAFTLYFLVVHFIARSRGHANCPCHTPTIEAIINLLAVIFWIIAASVETWMTIRFRDNGWVTAKNMRAAASAFSWLQVLLYLKSFLLAKFKGV